MVLLMHSSSWILKWCTWFIPITSFSRDSKMLIIWQVKVKVEMVEKAYLTTSNQEIGILASPPGGIVAVLGGMGGSKYTSTSTEVFNLFLMSIFWNSRKSCWKQFYKSTLNFFNLLLEQLQYCCLLREEEGRFCRKSCQFDKEPYKHNLDNQVFLEHIPMF